MSQNSVCHPDGTNLYLLESRITTPTEDGSVKEIRCGNQVVEIKLTTSLDKGSNNDGSGTGFQDAMLVDKDYIFKVAKYRSGTPADLSSIQWTVSYTSPETSLSKSITLECPQNVKNEPAPDTLTLNIKRFFRESGYDLCGCEITVTAYIDDPASGAQSTQFVHNRFRWFDAGKFSRQIDQRMQEPWRIDQGRSSLCGMVAVFYVMALTHRDDYKKLSIELHRTGTYEANNGYRIAPSSSMYDIQPTDQKYTSMQMWDADWIVLAGTRSSESSWGYNGIESGSLSQAQAINWPGMVTNLLCKLAGFPSSVNQTFSIFSSGTERTVQMLTRMDLQFQGAGHQFLLEIKPDLLAGKTSQLTTDRHWVVYAGGLEFFVTDNSTNGKWTNTINPTQYGTVSDVRMKIFTWGRNPETLEYYKINSEILQDPDEQIKTKDGISIISLNKGFHGYVEAS